MLSAGILKILDQEYPALIVKTICYGRLDLAFKTDSHGIPVLLFIGEKEASGKIKGECYTRKISFTSQGVVKNHWEHKGKAT
ncbi:hypothetical protein [Mucilaginibacter ginsenosidivorans]|uniref:Uncharacterized protein n=1 Tax=Mucilaginibacter ginsenosidivorans TaxID=398053 RepID=A0A5B8V0D6_9SPHI|nr:hypothetical protein [Mucilaginibacter ginsenosidivorans]QEC64699.1 hypothetical protein FRZ54_19740 [Mucilaginibacter ginsenosidivorans]